jgi:uncharacterized repeat protein (TIGR01451 family)
VLFSAAGGQPTLSSQVSLGSTINTLTNLAGPNNPSATFFAGQLNADNGSINTNGTFGSRNALIPSIGYAARQGWDVTSIGSTNLLDNATTSATLHLKSGGYSVNAVGLQVDNPIADLQASISGDLTNYTGELQYFYAAVTNAGPDDAPNPVITLQLPTGATLLLAAITDENGIILDSYSYTLTNNTVQWPFSSIPAFTTAYFEIQYSTTNIGALSASVTAGSDAVDPNPIDNTATLPITSLGYVNLTFTKNAPILVHGSFNYILTVSNAGPVTANTPTISDTIPTTMTPISLSDGGTIAGNVATWNLNSLSPNTSKTVTLTVLPNAVGSATNIASIYSSSTLFSVNNSTPSSTTTTNTLPYAASYSVGAPKGQSLALIPINQCYDSDGDQIAVISASATSGTISQLTASGFNYAPANSAPQTNIITYTITDGLQTSQGQITVLSTNRPPIANSFTNAGNVNQTSIISPLTYASDPDGDTISVTGVVFNNPNASVVLNNNQIFVTPASNYVGTVTFTYTIQDSYGAQANAQVTANFTPQPITAAMLAGSTALNTPVTLYPLPANIDINQGTLVLVSAHTTNGTLIVNTNLGSIQLTPPTDYKGNIVITYVIADQFSMVATGLINVAVTSLPPVPNDFTNYTRRNLPVTVSPLPYVTDPNNIAFGLSGTMCFIGTAVLAGTNIIYTPPTNFLGDAHFLYGVTNLVGDSAYGTVTVTVTNGTITTPTYALSTARSTTNLVPVLSQAYSAEGDTLTLIDATSTNAIVSLAGTNVQVTITNYPASDTAYYTVIDGFGGTNTGLINITSTNRPPIAATITAYNSHNAWFTIPAASLSTDPENDAISVVSSTTTNGSTYTDATNVYYLPATNFIGTNVLQYTIQDVFGATANGTITAIVTNLPPVATNDFYSVLENGTLNATNSVLTNDWDPQGNPMYALLIDTSHLSNPSGLTWSTNGTFIYKPATGFIGNDTFVYQAIDSHIGPTEATNQTYGVVNISVQASADVQVILTQSGSAYVGTPFSVFMTVTNLGPAASSNVVANCQLPANMQIVGVQVLSGNGTITSTNLPYIYCYDVSLAAGQADRYKFTVLATSQGQSNIRASSQAATADPNPSNNDGTAAISQTNVLVNASADIAVFSYGPSHAYQETTTNVLVVITNLGPSTATNITVYNFTTPSTTTSQTIAFLAPNTSSNLLFSIAVGDVPLTNSTYATSTTFDPNLANNSAGNTNGSFTTSITPHADLVTLFASLNAPGILVGGYLTNTVSVVNTGPAIASNIVLKLSYPSDLIYQTGAKSITNSVAYWNITNLLVGAHTNYNISFRAPTNGMKAFTVACTAATADLQPTNNNGTAAESQGTVLVAQPVFGTYIPKTTLDPQTGLYIENVLVTNLTAIPINGFLAEVTKLPTGVTLFNSQGTTNGYPYVTYKYPVAVGGVVPLTLEFSNSKRLAFTNGLIIVPFTGSYQTNTGAYTNVITVYNQLYTNNTYIIEFQTTIGHTYSVLYAPQYLGTNTAWKVAQPSITANSTYTIWVDTGPPKTDSAPTDSRYYELIEY